MPGAAFFAFTKAGMDKIAARVWTASLIDGNNHLIIQTAGNSPIDCGDVEGDRGPTGPPGSGSPAAVAAGIAELAFGGWTALPLAAGWVASTNYTNGTPRYGIMGDRLYFAGGVDRTGGTISGTSNVPISNALPAAAETPSKHILNYTRDQNFIGDIRYNSGERILRLQHHTGEADVVNGNSILLDGLSLSLS